MTVIKEKPGPGSAADLCHRQLRPELVLAVSGPLPSHFQSGVISSPPTRRNTTRRPVDERSSDVPTATARSFVGTLLRGRRPLWSGDVTPGRGHGRFNLRAGAVTVNANHEEKKRSLAAPMLTAAAKAAGARSRAWVEDVLVV